nr:integrase, catalytic region, zinc finger, CCHC-type, peptidase aspartic, catalytic [Tanacetum cinerariifolium]
MTGNLKLLINFVWKFMGTVRFGNDHVAAILGFEILEGVDLLKGDRSTNLYTINLHEMASASPICLMARASSTKSWLWHQRLSHLNFNTINDLAKNDLVSGLPKFKYYKEHLCPSCEQGKSKRASHPPKPVLNSRQRLHLLHMDLCGPMRIASINEKRFGISHQVSFVRTPQQNGVVERRNQTLVEAARTMLIFSHAPLFLWAEAIAAACFTQNRSIIHSRFNKTPYEIINGKKPDISFLYVFGALCYPKNDRENIRKLGAKGGIGFFIGYSVDSCAYRVYNQRTKKIMETINVSSDELSAMAFEQRSSKPGLQSMTSRQISSGLDLTYASSTITTQQPTEDTAPTPTNSSSQATNFPNTSQDVDGINSQQQQHAQQQGNQATIQTETVADNVSNAMFDANTFVNPFATPSTSAVESASSQYVDPSNMHTFYQPYPHEFQWTKDHPLEQVIGEPSRPVLKGIYSDPMVICLKRLDVWVLVPAPDNITPLTLKWLFKNKHDEEKTIIRNKSRLVVRGYRQEEGIDFEESFAPQAPRAWYNELSTFLLQNHFFKGTTDPMLFIRRFVNDILVVHVYVDDIIFGSTHPSQSRRDLPRNTPLDRAEVLGSDNGVTTSFQWSQDSRPHAQSTKKYSRRKLILSKSSAISDAQALPQKEHYRQDFRTM